MARQRNKMKARQVKNIGYRASTKKAQQIDRKIDPIKKGVDLAAELVERGHPGSVLSQISVRRKKLDLLRRHHNALPENLREELSAQIRCETRELQGILSVDANYRDGALKGSALRRHRSRSYLADRGYFTIKKAR